MSRGRDKFEKFKPIIMILVRIVGILPEKFLNKLLILFRNMTGLKGLIIRYVILKNLLPLCGDNVSVHPNVYLLNVKNLKVGNNVSIHPMCYIDADGGISIGNDISIAHGSTILSSSHNYEDLKNPIKDQGLVFKHTTIADNVWIGAKATILCGICISSGCIIAAGSVVTKNTIKNGIVAGVPGKTIKIRE